MLDSASAYTLSIVLVALMLSVSGIVLGLGYAIDDKRLKEFGKNELYQSLISGAIVGVLLVSFSGNGAITNLINNIADGTTATCPAFMQGNGAICFAYAYLSGLTEVSINGHPYPSLLSSSLDLLMPATLAYAVIGVIGSLSIDAVIVSVSLGSLTHPILTQLNYVIEVLGFAIIGIEAQAALLEAIAVVAIPLMLPVGLVLRSFYFTRRLGGSIIAIAVGLYCVFPLTYIFGASIMENYSQVISNASITTYLTNANSTSSSVFGQVSQIGGNRSIGIISSVTGLVGSLITGFENVIRGLVNAVAMLVVEVFFLPALSLILTTISIREFARILGSEISFGKLYMF